MTSVRHQGKLVDWHDDRGFGFVQPADGSKQVFLHISALDSARRPHVGDTIIYEPTAPVNGKIRASNAFIAGVAASPVGQKTTKQRRRLVETVTGIAVMVAIAFSALHSGKDRVSDSTSVSQIDIPPPPGYSIKGNVSVETGAKIYHVPGSDDYEATKIDPARGERWFRNEAEAVANGWRKAPR